ncbi:MAG: hypothetical protein Q4E60_07350 [Bacteroidales bacterium]|nr:hypothetical protein [Bacteroidales bacterium]
MTANEITFKELPFMPESNQVFYIENGYNKEVNDFIRGHYANLKSMFECIGMDFCYLPYMLREHDVEAKVRYYAPYLSSEQLVQQVQSNALVPYICNAEVKATLKPSLIFEGRHDDYLGGVRFLTIALDDLVDDKTKGVDQLMELVSSARNAFHQVQLEDILCEPLVYEDCSARCYVSAEPNREKGRQHSSNSISFSFSDSIAICCDMAEDAAQETQDELDEKQSLAETDRILRELRKTVQRLRLEGVSLMAIHEFIDKQEPLSRMTITPDYRIFLPDYNNIEIEMGALPKAIYFLYLRYPKGIISKYMPDYFGELLNIYKQLRPNTDDARLNLTITKVVNPLGNALNENIARIRKAFVEKFDEHLANKYIITGERGLQYSIALDRNLISWEE